MGPVMDHDKEAAEGAETLQLMTAVKKKLGLKPAATSVEAFRRALDLAKKAITAKT